MFNFSLIASLTTLAFLFCQLPASAVPLAKSSSPNVSATSGKVKAELFFFAPSGIDRCFARVNIKITRENTVLLDQPIVIRNECDGEIWNNLCTWYDKETLQVQDLDGDGDPEVITRFYSGGTHCCTVSRIYQYQKRQNRYEAYTFNTADDWRLSSGYELKDLDRDGILEFVSEDPRFDYAFTSYAGSRNPIQIWQYRQGRLIDVTRRYPQLVARDATKHWQEFVKQGRSLSELEGGRGVLAAYLADMYLLGRGDEGWRQVRQAYRGRDRNQFFANLGPFLQKHGYAASQTRLESGQVREVASVKFDGELIATRYPATMSVDWGCSGEGCGYTFTFKPQSGSLANNDQILRIIVSHHLRAAEVEQLTIGRGGSFERDNWTIVNAPAPAELLQLPWVNKVISFSAPKGMRGQFVLGEAQGRVVSVDLLYSEKTSSSYWSAAKMILENLRFKP